MFSSCITRWSGPASAAVRAAPVVADIDVVVARRHRREIPLVAEARFGLIERELDRLIGESGDA